MIRRCVLVLALCLFGCASRGGPAAGAPKTNATAETALANPIGDALRVVMTAVLAEYEDPALAAYLTRVGQRVARPRAGERWSFVVVDRHDAGAWAVAGRNVYVTRGLLAHLESEAELAAVLAHEIAHVRAGHTARSLLRVVEDAPASDAVADVALERDEERQADRLGVELLTAAGYDPRAMLDMLKHLHDAAEDDVRKTDDDRTCDHHPPLNTRLARASLAIQRPGGELARQRYLRRLRGLSLSEAPAGIRVDGRRLMATRERFAWQLPAGYSWTLGDGRAYGARPGQEAEVVALRLSLKSQARVAHALEDQLRRHPHRVHTLPDHVAIAYQTTGDTHTTSLRFAGALWVAASSGDVARRASLTFSRLPLGATGPSGPRLELLEVTEASTLRALGARCDGGLSSLAALNHLRADQTVGRGTTLKCAAGR